MVVTAARNPPTLMSSRYVTVIKPLLLGLAFSRLGAAQRAAGVTGGSALLCFLCDIPLHLMAACFFLQKVVAVLNLLQTVQESEGPHGYRLLRVLCTHKFS